MKLKHMDYEITCIAPIHIGNGTVYKAYEYLYDDTRHQVVFLNEVKWIVFLAEHGLMDAFAAYVGETAKALGARGNFTGQYMGMAARIRRVIRCDTQACSAHGQGFAARNHGQEEPSQ